MPSLRLDIQTVHSNLIRRSSPDQLRISGQQADLIIDKKKSHFTMRQKADTVEINNYPAWSQLDNSKRVGDMESKVSGYSKNKAMRAIAEYSSDGDQLMAIERKGAKPFASIAKRKSEKFSKAEVDIGYFPKNAIKVRVRKGYIKSSFTPSEIKTDVQKNLKIDVVHGSSSSHVDRYPEVRINVVG